MEYLIGIVLAVGLLVFAWVVGFDRDRVFYPTLLIVIATYYVLFAVMSGSRQALIAESVVAAIFLLIAVAGFKINLWLVAAALACHGIFDFSHARFITDPGVPMWWPGFCLAFDAIAGCVLSMLLLGRHISPCAPFIAKQ